MTDTDPGLVEEAVWLVDNGACLAICLFGMESGDCSCRCGGEHHGMIRGATIDDADELIRDWSPQKRCRCGRAFVRVYFMNSGTTNVSEACPSWAEDNTNPDFYHQVPGHQFVVTTTENHRALRCCDIREVRE